MLVYNERLGVNVLNTSVGGRSCSLCPMGKGCYSKRNWSMTVSSKRKWLNNSRKFKTKEGQKELISDISRQKYVRLYSAGDIQSIRDAKRLYGVAKYTSNERVWLSTASWRIPGVLPYLAKIRDIAPGWCVRLSAGTESEDNVPQGFKKSCVIGSRQKPKEHMTLCKKSRGEGLHKDKSSCVKCGYMCWDNKIELIAYRKH